MAFSSSQPWSQLMRSKWLVAPAALPFFHVPNQTRGDPYMACMIYRWISDSESWNMSRCSEQWLCRRSLELTISRHNFWQGNHLAYRTTRSLRCGSYRPLNSVKFPVFLLNKKMSCVFASCFQTDSTGQGTPKGLIQQLPCAAGPRVAAFWMAGWCRLLTWTPVQLGIFCSSPKNKGFQAVRKHVGFSWIFSVKPKFQMAKFDSTSKNQTKHD